MSDPRSRYICGGICLVAAAVMLVCGWLMPVYLQAVDVAVIRNAARHPTAVETPPAIAFPAGLGGELVTPFLIRPENRAKALAILSRSPSPAVQALLRCRQLTNTVLFPPSASAAGQAFDAATAICGLLLDGKHLTPALSDLIFSRADAAIHGGNPQPMEEILTDELSLGQRLDWRRLVIFNQHIEYAQTLAVLADAARNAGDQLSVLFAAVQMSQKPAEVARYLSHFSQTGLRDLAASERFGAEAVNELLQRDQQLYAPDFRRRVTAHAPFDWFFRAASDYALKIPALALGLKWFFYFSGGFFIVVGVQLARPGASLNPARETLFALGVLLVALLLSEPFLARENQPGTAPFRLRLSPFGGAVAHQINPPKSSLMNTSNMTANLLTLLLFFVLQALIYVACLARLAETLRQNVPARVKLKLLENEDHLFDAGLYLGFVGTIICLILVSLGVLQFSLMAAYSSTSFGIIFVSVLKIFKVRPARRRLLLQAEQENAPTETPARMAAPALVATP